MTRGTLYLILPDNTNLSAHLLSSVEFNGDQYFDGHGQTHIKALENINNVESFKDYLKKFNDLIFQYKEGAETYKSKTSLSKNKHGLMINLKAQSTFTRDDGQKINYSEYTSDWLFFKNLTTKTVGLETKDDMLFILKPNEQVALYYGNYDEHYTSIEQGQQVFGIKDEDIDLSDYNKIFNIKQPDIALTTTTT